MIRAILWMALAACSTVCVANPCADMRNTLATMREVDQRVREEAMRAGPQDERTLSRVAIVDRQNTRQLSSLLARCGWPTVHNGDWQASDDAWLLAQHADQDRAFQRRVLMLLERAVAAGHARGGHLAYLSDRLAVTEGRPQLFATQLKLEGCKLELFPIDDRARVDARRAAIPGMPTLEAYLQVMREKALPPECSPSATEAAAPVTP